METENNVFFDLPALLKQGDLDIRHFADRHALSADEYFGILAGFTSIALHAESALCEFIGMSVEKESYKCLDDTATILKELVCDKYVTSIYSILDAYEKGNWRLAAAHAERIEEDFTMFLKRILAAKKKRRPDFPYDTALPLKDYIKLLDDEEANRKLLILAVDDSPGILNSVSALLGADYKVFTLPKSTMLETVLQQITPELFLLDYLMPDINGLELIPIIRGFEEHSDTPIILLTSEGTLDTVTAALALGAADFIVKPFKPDALREKVDKHITRKKNF